MRRAADEPNRIRELRERLGWTKTRLAEELNTTRKTIGELESGKQQLTLAWMERIAWKIGTTPADLLPRYGFAEDPVVGEDGTAELTDPEGDDGEFLFDVEEALTALYRDASLPKARKEIVVEALPLFQEISAETPSREGRRRKLQEHLRSLKLFLARYRAEILAGPKIVGQTDKKRA